MKKIISAILVLVMLAGCAVMLASCSKPELDFDKAKEALEANDYEVQLMEEASDIPLLGEELVGVVQVLFAMEGTDDMLVIIEFEKAKTAKLYLKSIELMKNRIIEYAELEIKNYEHIISKYENELKSDEIDEYEDQIKDLKDEIEETEENMVYGRSGNIIWIGTKDAVEATRK